MPDQAAPTDDIEISDLLLATLQALTEQGRDAEVDVELETIEVGPGDEVLAVVLSASRSVMLYAVRPKYVPESVRLALGEAVNHANTRLHTSAIEFDQRTGHLSVRAGIEIGDVVVPPEVFAGLIVNALDEVERAYDRFMPALEDVIAGRLSPREARARWESSI